MPPRETEESIYTKCGLGAGVGGSNSGYIRTSVVGGRHTWGRGGGSMWETGKGGSKGPVRRVYDVPRAQSLTQDWDDPAFPTAS